MSVANVRAVSNNSRRSSQKNKNNLYTKNEKLWQFDLQTDNMFSTWIVSIGRHWVCVVILDNTTNILSCP